MIRNYTFLDINEALPELLGDLYYEGEEFRSRAGLTRELMHVGITLMQPWKREIVVPERKASIAAQIYETMWVMAGRDDIAGLSNYLPRAGDFSDDGETWRAGYGKRLRRWPGRNFSNTHDQLAYVVETLRSNPGSRQAVISLWDPTVDSKPGKDIACNNWLSFSARNGRLDLHVGLRSNDAMWGWSGINAFEWSVLLEIVAGMCGLGMGSLHFSTTSFHLYEQHFETARIILEKVAQPSAADSPRFNATELVGESWDYLCDLWFHLEACIRTGQPVDRDIKEFPEPMLQSWLRVLQWYWSGGERFLEPLAGTRLHAAALMGVKPAGEPQTVDGVQVPVPGVYRPDQTFLGYVNALHAEKHAAYGDSWKRRGEPGILGNIARKVDRISSGLDTSDETQADTAVDLLVYLSKYRLWLDGLEANPGEVALLLSGLKGTDRPSSFNEDLDFLFTCNSVPDKKVCVDLTLEKAYSHALSLWS